MHAFDASSIIYGWDNYPIAQFPGLWDWVGSQVLARQLQLPEVAYDEVCNKTPDCGVWLNSNGLQKIAIGNAVLQYSLYVKSLLGIVGDKYGGGVGENDLLIISAARNSGFTLVSNETRQNNLPKVLANYKIPAVCALGGVNLHCIDFLDYIKQSKQVFR